MTNGKYQMFYHVYNQYCYSSTTKLAPVSLHGGIPFGQSQQADSGISEYQTQMREMNPMPSLQRGPGPKLAPASYATEGYDTLPKESEVRCVQVFNSWEPGSRGAGVVLIHSPSTSPGGTQTLSTKYLCQVDSHQEVLRELGRADLTCTPYSSPFTVSSRSSFSSQISIFPASTYILFLSLLKWRASYHHTPWNNSFQVWTRNQSLKPYSISLLSKSYFCASNNFCSSFFIFYWSKIALQCCVSFCCTMKWISYMYTYIPSLLDHPPPPFPPI